jgi:hypothetical protein
VSTSIHAQHTLSAAEDFLITAESKSKSSRAVTVEVAVLFFDQGLPVTQK